MRQQLADEAAAGRIRPITADQFMANLMGVLFFPFIARAALGFMLGLDGDRFAAFIEERKATLPDFFLRGLRP